MPLLFFSESMLLETKVEKLSLMACDGAYSVRTVKLVHQDLHQKKGSEAGNGRETT